MKSKKLISLCLIVSMIAGLLVIPEYAAKAEDVTTSEVPAVTTSYLDKTFEALNTDGSVDTTGLALLPKNAENRVEAVKDNHYLLWLSQIAKNF